MSNAKEKYRIKWTTRFKKDYKLIKRRGYDMNLLKKVVHLIALGSQQQKLIDEYNDHAFGGNWECVKVFL